MKKTVKIQSVKNQCVLADQCVVADSFLTRLKGLIGKKSLSEGEGLLLRPCSEIHMWFMSLAIDVVFLVSESRDGVEERARVTSVRSFLRPWLPLPVGDPSATVTLELPVGTIARCDVREGDSLCIS